MIKCQREDILLKAMNDDAWRRKAMWKLMEVGPERWQIAREDDLSGQLLCVVWCGDTGDAVVFPSAIRLTMADKAIWPGGKCSSAINSSWYIRDQQEREGDRER